MEIIYLQQLRDEGNSLSPWPMSPVPLSEIEQLEQLYNNGNTFPKVLREFLYLAGNYCPVVDTGIHDTQQEEQEWYRERLLEEGKVFSRPFFVVDAWNYDSILYMYLDEGDNPLLRTVYVIDEAAGYNPVYETRDFTLKDFIENNIKLFIKIIKIKNRGKTRLRGIAFQTHKELKKNQVNNDRKL
jgi:hypothetical protein